MTINIDRKVTQMLWAPLESLDNSKRHQFCYTDNNGNTHFFGYHTNNGTNIRRLIEHAFNYPAAAQNLPLTDHQKAVFFSQTLLPPATGVFQQELSKQVAAAGTYCQATCRSRSESGLSSAWGTEVRQETAKYQSFRMGQLVFHRKRCRLLDSRTRRQNGWHNPASCIPRHFSG